MSLQSPLNSVVGPRVLWDKMVNKAITHYEYSFDEARLIKDLGRLGFERDQVLEMLEDDETAEG